MAVIGVLVLRALSSEVRVAVADSAPHHISIRAYRITASSSSLPSTSPEAFSTTTFTSSFKIYFFQVGIRHLGHELEASLTFTACFSFFPKDVFSLLFLRILSAFANVFSIFALLCYMPTRDAHRLELQSSLGTRRRCRSSSGQTRTRLPSRYLSLLPHLVRAQADIFHVLVVPRHLNSTLGRSL